MSASLPLAVPGLEADDVKGQPKLHGRAFYESIGSPRLVLAPMVDQSEFAWRMLCRSFLPHGDRPGLVAYTPMFHARLFQATAKNRDTFFRPLRDTGIPSYTTDSLVQTPYSPASPSTQKGAPFLDGNPSIDRPLIVQFCANQPDELFDAARLVQPYCDAVDINLGCPQGIARKGKYGAFLQEDWTLISSMISRLHNGLAVPITAKFRILESPERTLEYAQMLLKSGASWLAVHGRERHQKGHLTGLADWTYIKYLRDNLPPDTVIFANGNILEHDDLDECLMATGADGVMTAEGCLANPAIFAGPVTSPHDPRFHPEMYWFPRPNDYSLVGTDDLVDMEAETASPGRDGWRVDAVVRRYLDIIYRHVLEVEPPIRSELYVPPRLIALTKATTEQSNNHTPSSSAALSTAIKADESPSRPLKRQRLDNGNGVDHPSSESETFATATDATSTIDGQSHTANLPLLSSNSSSIQAQQPSSAESDHHSKAAPVVEAGEEMEVAKPSLLNSNSPITTTASTTTSQSVHTSISIENSEYQGGGNDNGTSPNPPIQPTTKAKSKAEPKSKAKANKHKTPNDPSLRAMQAHLFSLIPRPMLTLHAEDVRTRLARTRAGDMEAYEEFSQAVDRAVEEGLRAYENGKLDLFGNPTSGIDQDSVAAADISGKDGNEKTKEEEGQKQEQGQPEGQEGQDVPESSEGARQRARRAWWICQSYVRPLPAEALLKGALTAKKGAKAKSTPCGDGC